MPGTQGASRDTMASLNGWRPADVRALADHWHRSAYMIRLRALSEKEVKRLADHIGRSRRTIHYWRSSLAPPTTGAILIAATMGTPDRWPEEIAHKLLAVRRELETRKTDGTD